MFNEDLYGLQEMVRFPTRGPPKRLLALARDFGQRNQRVAVLAEVSGRRRESERRAREIIAIGHDLVRQPVLRMAETGSDLVRDGAEALQWIGGVRDDAALRDEGALLLATFDSASVNRWSGFWKPSGRGWTTWHNGGSLLMLDPVSPPGLDVVADTALAPFVRWELVRSVYTSYCLSIREMCFGVDPRRLDLLTRVATVTRDLPHIDAYIARLEEAMLGEHPSFTECADF